MISSLIFFAEFDKIWVRHCERNDVEWVSAEKWAKGREDDIDEEATIADWRAECEARADEGLREFEDDVMLTLEGRLRRLGFSKARRTHDDGEEEVEDDDDEDGIRDDEDEDEEGVEGRRRRAMMMMIRRRITKNHVRDVAHPSR